MKPKPRVYLDVPSRRPLSNPRLAALALLGAILSPLYWLAALLYGTPGLAFRGICTRMGLRAVLGTRSLNELRTAYNLIFFPMDSTRYFEFDALWRFAGPSFPLAGRYLDVSSPRAFPLALLRRNRDLDTTLLNPNSSDLRITSDLARAMGVRERIRLLENRADDAPLEPESFDLITSVSVIEHIPDDVEAIIKIWSWLKPGGTFLLTVPCAAQASEQFTNENYYRVLDPEGDGYVFFQRFYDESLLETNIFSNTGHPEKMMVFGEKKPGALLENTAWKRSTLSYPFWIEPVMIGKGFRRFDSVASLPGEGVVALKLVKS